MLGPDPALWSSGVHTDCTVTWPKCTNTFCFWRNAGIEPFLFLSRRRRGIPPNGFCCTSGSAILRCGRILGSAAPQSPTSARSRIGEGGGSPNATAKPPGPLGPALDEADRAHREGDREADRGAGGDGGGAAGGGAVRAGGGALRGGVHRAFPGCEFHGTPLCLYLGCIFLYFCILYSYLYIFFIYIMLFLCIFCIFSHMVFLYYCIFVCVFYFIIARKSRKLLSQPVYKISHHENFKILLRHQCLNTHLRHRPGHGRGGRWMPGECHYGGCRCFPNGLPFVFIFRRVLVPALTTHLGTGSDRVVEKEVEVRQPLQSSSFFKFPFIIKTVFFCEDLLFSL